MSKKRNFVKGSARSFAFGVNVDIDLTELNRMVEDGDIDVVDARNGHKYVKLTLAKKSNVDQYGNDYMIYENDFKPDPKLRGSKPSDAKKEAEEPDNDVLFF